MDFFESVQVNAKVYLPRLKRLLSLHYVLNAFACFHYVISRYCVPICRRLYPGEECDLDWRDTEILMFLCFVIVVKNRRWKPTQWTEYVGNVFFFTKCCNVLLFMRHDIRWGTLYMIFCLVKGFVVLIGTHQPTSELIRSWKVLFLVFPEPSYVGPENVRYFRGQALQEELYHNPKVTWIVEFFAGWSPPCTYFAPLFANISLKYDHEYLRFGKLDVGRYPKIAEIFKVDTSVSSKQLPTLIVFENGKEKLRRPVTDELGTIKKYTFTEQNVVRDFNLNELFSRSKQLAEELAKQERKNKKE